MKKTVHKQPGFLKRVFSRQDAYSPNVKSYKNNSVMKRMGNVGRRVFSSVRAAYHDFTSDTKSTQRHWQHANNLDVNSIQSLSERKKGRNRSRYEERENSYYAGILDTLINDIIGPSPRLQILTDDTKLNQEIEHDWKIWGKEVKLAPRMRTHLKTRMRDGESFCIKRINPKLKNAVKLDLWCVEADQVTSLMERQADNEDDGIMYDQYGNPASYRVLVNHPGGTGGNSLFKFETIDADKMIHSFKMERPGQRRGFPEFKSAMEAIAQLRDYTLSVMKAARVAADIAAVLKTDNPDLDEMTTDSIEESGDEEDTIAIPKSMDVIDIERGQYLVLPAGYDISQLKAEQPTTTYKEFKREMIGSIGRPKNMPYNVAACDSSDYNYASGRLDHQKYDKYIQVERFDFSNEVMDRIFDAWLRQWIIENSRGDLIENDTKIPHAWYYDGSKHVDPVKEAKGQGIRLANGMTNLAIEQANEGLDWKETMDKSLEIEEYQMKERKRRGLPPLPVQDEQPAAGKKDSKPESESKAIAELRELVEDMAEALE